MCHVEVFFPFLLFYFSLLLSFSIFRRDTTYKGIFYIFTLFLSFFVAYLIGIFSEVVLEHESVHIFLMINSVDWLSLDLSIYFRLDALSYLFVLLVAVIGLATNFYILNYMKYEAHEDVFALLINWFMFSMIMLVLANNLFSLFLGWESIGLSSFFLINFWNTRRGTVKASFKAFFFNKMSDVFLFVFILSINYMSFGNNLQFVNLVTSLSPENFSQFYEFAGISLFVCTLFKSAQIVGHLWLPDSMEAPVPASALIHSATLVSAGIYLLLRFTPIVTLNSLQSIAIIVGSITAAYGGIVSASQTDMKKLLAYSTISHCGFLFVTVGTQVYFGSVIYLFLHGLFKASTFFCAGSFIRVAGSQDTRHMGALSRVIPVDTIFLIICAFNLGGLPFSLGYLYKAMLISSTLSTPTNVGVLGLCAVGLLSSLVYVYRLVYYSAFDTAKEFFPQFIYELQQKQINVVSHWSLTSIVQIIAVSIILVFTLYIYVFFLSYFVYSDFILDHMPILLDVNSQLMSNANTFSKLFYELFYTLYLIVAITLIIVVWRVEYTFLYRINFLLTLSLTTIFAVFWSNFL